MMPIKRFKDPPNKRITRMIYRKQNSAGCVMVLITLIAIALYPFLVLIFGGR